LIPQRSRKKDKQQNGIIIEGCMVGNYYRLALYAPSLHLFIFVCNLGAEAKKLRYPTRYLCKPIDKVNQFKRSP
jgi:hypothetical protein